jgi:uncharacterized protein (DUF885 family)
MKSKILSTILIILLTGSLILCGCNQQPSQEKLQRNFDSFLNDIFVTEVQADSLSLNYSLADPESFGIVPKEATLGEYSIHHMTEDLSQYENYLGKLMTYDYNKLTADQQLTYDILKDYLEADLKLGRFQYYNECLGPTTGIQAQLPILLAEYSFHERRDIEEYLALLPCVYDYFKDIVQYEREKSERGLFMSDAVAEKIIDQCEAFIEDPGNNFLIQYFNEKISVYTNLSEEEIISYEDRNRQSVLAYIIPAYQMLINALDDLTGTGTNEAGLYYYPEGRAYYECLAKYKTGSSKSMEEMSSMLEDAIGKGIVKITYLTMSDPTLLDKYLSFTSFPITDPEEIIDDLKTDITRDFPASIAVNCDIKYVPKSLSDYLSPAMYLIPPIDSYTDNDIYINGNDAKTLSMIYTTVAHESYPGHLYQCVYFRSHNPAPIRSLMNFLGYDEGWATYVEMYSYHTAGIDETLADFLEANNVVILCMYARADIGIHYEGWTEETTVKYINNFISDKETAAAIYQILLEEPAIYLPYSIGYLEIMELRAKAEERFGDDFKAKDFHTFLLDIGPAQFDIINRYMDSKYLLK